MKTVVFRICITYFLQSLNLYRSENISKTTHEIHTTLRLFHIPRFIKFHWTLILTLFALLLHPCTTSFSVYGILPDYCKTTDNRQPETQPENLFMETPDTTFQTRALLKFKPSEILRSKENDRHPLRWNNWRARYNLYDPMKVRITGIILFLILLVWFRKAMQSLYNIFDEHACVQCVNNLMFATYIRRLQKLVHLEPRVSAFL